MKKILLIVLGLAALLLFVNRCFAEVYVIYKNDTKEIYTLSEKDDTIIPASCTKVQLKGTVQELGLDLNPTYYKYDKNKFIRNQSKIDTEEAAELAKQQAKQKKEQDKAKGVDKLKALGLTDDEIKGLIE